MTTFSRSISSGLSTPKGVILNIAWVTCVARVGVVQGWGGDGGGVWVGKKAL